MEADLIVRCRRAVTPDGVRPVAVVVADGKIVALEPVTSRRSAAEVVDAGDAVLLPGLVDPHVHINEPGRSEWEGFASATRAAAAGGITTLIDMPLNSSPVTTHRAALAAKAQAAAGQCLVDYGFWGGVVPGNAGELPDLLAAGALGCKCFLVDSGIPEFPAVSSQDLLAAMPILAAHGAVLLAHAEDPNALTDALRGVAGSDPRRYCHYLASRPPAAETAAISQLLALCASTGCALHIVHLATAQALPMLAQARAARLPVTVETCPHYLTLTAEEIPDGATVFKCAPPIRSRDEGEGLWQGLARGIIDFVASDHSPCPPAMKQQSSGDFFAAWGGIASLQLTLPLLWTAARQRGFGLNEMVAWLAERPARRAGLGDRKGRLAIGYDADLVLFAPDASFIVEPERLFHRHALTPYAGRMLCGVVEQTWVRGIRVFAAGEPAEVRPGQWLRKDSGCANREDPGG